MKRRHIDTDAPGAPRRRWWRALGCVVIALLVVLVGRILVVRSFDDGPPPPALAVIGKLPITLPDGRKALLRDLVHTGAPTVITLWASWCGPCRSEAPKIADLRRRFGRSDLNLIYLNVRDPGASREDLARYMVEYGMAPDAYAVLPDSQIRSLTKAADMLIPRTLVFDRSGAPLATITGYNPLALARVAGLVGR